MRSALDALLDIDDAMADVVLHSTQPALAAIKLAWWRERLQELDQGVVPAEPRLRTAATELLPRAIRGDELSGLEDGYLALLQEPLLLESALERGVLLFTLASRLLGGAQQELGDAGRIYAAGHLRRRRLVQTTSFVVPRVAGVPKRLRPVTALAALARRDLVREEREATPARAFTLLAHRLTGRIR